MNERHIEITGKKKVGKEAKKKAIYRYEILDIKKCEIIHS